ncbi:MAG: winged helix DNA-binding domain-containing protein [Verrucomicrobiota bacterium]
MSVKVTWRQALAWRMRRQLLDPIADLPAEAVVRRLCGVQAQVMSSAALAIRTRQATPRTGEIESALADGRLIRTWAMRGTLHLLTPEDAGAFLSLLAAGRSWERPSWQRAFGLTPKELADLRIAVREALDGRVLTREELVAAVVARPGLAHTGASLASGWGSVLKPLAFQGDLCFGPSRGSRVTFMRPQAASARWAGVPAADEAAPVAILAYLRSHGPASADGFSSWLSRGRVAKRDLRRWFAAVDDRLAEVDVEGERSLVAAEDLDELATTRPTDVVRLVAGFDQWVLGPGTDDPRVVPPDRRAAVSRQSGWIAPTVIAGGVVAGTWGLDGDTVRVAWFREAGGPPTDALDAEASRLSSILGRRLGLTIGLD